MGFDRGGRDRGGTVAHPEETIGARTSSRTPGGDSHGTPARKVGGSTLTGQLDDGVRNGATDPTTVTETAGFESPSPRDSIQRLFGRPTAGDAATASRYPALRRALGDRGGPAPTIHDAATAAVEHKAGGASVDPEVAGRVGAHLGADFSGVRVHSDPLAQQATAAMGARAFAHGSDVFLGPGESGGDLGLMAHELTHVVQQGAAGQPTPQRAVTVGEAHSPAEHEADQVAADVTSGQGEPAQLVVDHPPVAAGQMLKAPFFQQLRAEVTAAANDELGPVYSTIGCPYIEQVFQRYDGQPAAALLALVFRFAPATRSARTAVELIAPAVARVREGVRQWRQTGQVPPEITGVEPAAQAVSSAPIPAAQALRAPDGHDALAPLEADRGPGAALGADGAQAHTGVAARKASDAGPAPGTGNALVAQLARGAGGIALDAGAAAAIGDAYGEDFSGVRVHTGPDAAAMTSSRGAAAVTVGNDIAFAPGRYQPGTPHGDALLAHELAHVAQQRGAPRRPQDKIEEHATEDAHEADADRAAEGAVARIHGGAKGKRVKPQLKTDWSLQLSTCSSTPKFTDAFVLALKAKLEAKPADKAGFFSDLRAQAGAKAGNVPLREGLEWFRDQAYITDAEVFRAVALTAFGAEASWPDVVKNYADSADKGLFPVKAGLPPTTKDALTEYCVLGAGEKAAAPGDAMAEYRRKFDAKWTIAPYAGLDTAFDPKKDSKGPRTPRARQIFDDLYKDAATKTAYDDDTPKGFRAQCDSYLIPEGMNDIASPRLEELRLALAAAATPTSVTGTGDPIYTAIVTAVTPKATALDGKDRAHIEQEHEWRTVIEKTVKGTSDDISEAVRADLWNVITSSRPAGPVVPVAPPPPPALPPPVLSKAHKDFLASITMSATTPQDASNDRHPVKFAIKSATPNPALAVSRRITVEPGGNVVDGAENESPWPDKASAMDHTATVDPETPPPGPLKVTAKLTMPPVKAADFAEKKFDVELHDKRLDWLKSHIVPGVTVFDERNQIAAVNGTSAPYSGGQLPIMVVPALTGGNNPGLNLSVDGEIKKLGGGTIAIVRKRFPNHGKSLPLGAAGAADGGPYINLLEPAPPPAPGSPDKYEITLRVFQGPGAGALVHTLPVLKIEATAGLPPVAGGDAKVLSDDTAELNKPIATAGTFLAEMKSTAVAGSVQERMADAIAGGAVKVKAMVVRSDSAAWLKSKGNDEKRFVAWAHGTVDDAHTTPGDPDDAGHFVWAFPDTVWVAVTRNVHTGAKESRGKLFDFISHEGIHAADKIPTTVTPFERYKREFRAYWIEGTGAGESEGFDATITATGPKSPRANKIFQQLYNTYSYVKPPYDANKDGMRDQVDRYFYPDGVNLTLSPKLADLRREIESYAGAGYAAKKTAVTAKFAACSADDKKEITNNRAWRDLVEEIFKNKAEATEIKGILVIPS